MPTTPPAPLLTIRAAVILLLALVTGVLAGFLSYHVDESLPGAVLWGGGSAGASIVLFHSIIGRT